MNVDLLKLALIVQVSTALKKKWGQKVTYLIFIKCSLDQMLRARDLKKLRRNSLKV
jgi:hypothetical protein